jgi:spoIIIJ-associated protein
MANLDIKAGLDSQIRHRLTELLQPFGLEPQITTSNQEGVLTVDVKTGRDDLFIRGGADPLLALQHILRIIMRHDAPEELVTISLNIGGFQQHQRARLAQVAKDAAEQARATNMAVYLPPMSSYERRLVHLSLVEDKSVTSDSEGEGEERRIVVKPV